MFYSEFKEKVAELGTIWQTEKAAFSFSARFYTATYNDEEQCISITIPIGREEGTLSINKDGTLREISFANLNELREQFRDRPRLFVDMDGTLAVFRKITVDIEEWESAQDVSNKVYEILKSPGYFQSLPPQMSVVSAVKQLMKQYSNQIEVFILSSFLPDCAAKDEKNQWLDKYLPTLDADHRIFVPDGDDKKRHVPGGVYKTDYLLDDYTHNLSLWAENGIGIKLLNGINATKGTWDGVALDYTKTGKELAKNLVDIICNQVIIKDNPPVITTEPDSQTKEMEIYENL